MTDLLDTDRRCSICGKRIITFFMPKCECMSGAPDAIWKRAARTNCPKGVVMAVQEEPA
jgi:hypothetical protein